MSLLPQQEVNKMSTVSIKRTPVEAKWTIQKNQEEAARAFATNMAAVMAVLGKQGDQAVQEFQNIQHKFQLEHLKKLGVKTPLDLVKAKAEFETNVFGSKIQIEGDENNARLIYDHCAMWDAMTKLGALSPEKEEKAGEHFQTCVQNFAKEWGFKGDVQMDGKTCTVSFSK